MQALWRTSLLFVAVVSTVFAQSEARKPIIDMHLHAMEANELGQPPRTICAPLEYVPSSDPRDWANYGESLSRKPPCAKPLNSPADSDELMHATLRWVKQLHVIAVTSGTPETVNRWKKVGGEVILPATDFSKDGPTPEELRKWVRGGQIVAFAEIGTQYEGIPPNSPLLEPYFALAEELDVPVGIHMGPGPPGAPYIGQKDYRARLSSLFLLEDVLVRHPKLRVWAMHAGWPLGDDAVAMLYTHPQLYVDTGLIDYFLPREEFYRYLKRLIDAGFENRIMFGSDQMIWPDALPEAIRSIESAPFLTETQKRDILYNNAARFLRLKQP
jgi:uncharacterized protein